MKQIAHLEYGLSQTGGGTIDIELGVFKNNMRIEGYLTTRQLSSGAAEGTLQPTTSFIDGDVLEVYVRNMSNTNNIQVSKFNLVTR